MKKILVILVILFMVLIPSDHAYGKMNDVDDTTVYIEAPEEGANFAEATELTIKNISTVYEGALFLRDEEDYFKFKVPANGMYEIFTTDIYTVTTTAKLYDNEKSKLELNLMDAGDGNFSFKTTLKEGKYYYLCITSPTNETGDYNLHIVSLSETTDSESNTINNAEKMSYDEWSTSIDYIGDYDYFIYEVEESGIYTFSSKHTEKFIDPELILFKGKEAIAWDWDSGKNGDFKLSTFLRKEKYTLGIYSANATGDISFTIKKDKKSTK